MKLLVNFGNKSLLDSETSIYYTGAGTSSTVVAILFSPWYDNSSLEPAANTIGVLPGLMA
jgi:hypothetical protein